jgi:predicted HAD superfamily hydrolase
LENGLYEGCVQIAASLFLDIQYIKKMNIAKELKRIKRFDLVSFDIFDTLIVRSVSSPKEIFFLAGQKVLDSPVESAKFQSARILAENIARKKSKTGEVNLDDIYNSLVGYSADIRINLKEAELRAELESCRPREEIIALYNSIKELGKDVVLISDMYLPGAFIERMLANCCVCGMKGTFISNELGCDKKSGKLFTEVQKRIIHDNGKHIHYGDSFKADFIGALKVGVKPRFIFKRHFFRKLLGKII